MAYKNPIPHFGGKRYRVQMIFNFENWTERKDAASSILEHINKHPKVIEQCLADITPPKEYEKE